MKYAPLGRTGLEISRLILGTMNFGTHTAPDDAKAIMSRALDVGYNFIDTANGYPARDMPGVTETIIGEWLREERSRRGRIVLATKVYGKMGPGPNDHGLSAYHVKRACEASLRRLQTDHIDLYQMHHVDRRVPWDEIWQAMEQLVREGKVTYVGSSNFAGWHIATACQEASKRGLMGLVSEQSKYSPMVRDVELEVAPACLHYGLGLIPYSPLGGGTLAGVLGREAGEGRRSQLGRRLERRREQVTAWEALCKDLGEEPANVALAWVLAQPAVAAPITGPRTMEQMEGALRAVEIELDSSTLERIDEIWPGPGGAAPEAYAW